MRTLRMIALVTPVPLVLAGAGLAHPHLLSTATAGRWAALHIALLPVFPLLAAGFVVPLWGRPRRDAAGALTVLAWVGAFVYATFYTGLDTVAGVAAGTVGRHAAEGSDLGPVVFPLFDTGDALGLIGTAGFGLAALATSAALLLRYGIRTVPGAVVLLAASYSFLDSHIFWPRGVLTMLALALAFALLAAAARPAGQAATRPAAADPPDQADQAPVGASTREPEAVPSPGPDPQR